MVTRTLSVKLDEATCERLRDAAQRMGRAPHWLLRRAVATYLDALETGIATSQPDSLGGESMSSVGRGPCFVEFATRLVPQSPLRAAITAAYRRPETEQIPVLIEQARLPARAAEAVRQLAVRLAAPLRDQNPGTAGTGGRTGLVQGLLQEFSLSSEEGVALMCLAEALLRIPDKATRDALIRDKISTGNWRRHLGHSPSPFVNAATWGLLMTGKLVATHNETGMSAALNRILGKSGEPLVRRGVDMAMRLMGEQFVIGESIAAALANASAMERKGFRYSYDMLGEAARTETDAQYYLAAYQQAIHAIGNAAHGRAIYEGPGISIKLSALHPRYGRSQRERVMEELYPRLRRLVLLARHYDIGLNIDAEEAERLELSLDLLERLCHEPELAGWNGIGFVVQAYQKRCSYVIDALIDLARRSQHRLMVRLVKGAYWDSEIKLAQVLGLEGYPVYTRKAHTDVAYIACARMLLSAPDAVFPQFATHNAQTLATVYHLAGPGYYPGQYEFQCLHGMGEALYDQVVGKPVDGKLNRPCRIYAPVGRHDTLLAYLVRRLLENGANTSFVHRIADSDVSLDELLADPVATVEARAVAEGRLGLPHPLIPLPRAIYGGVRDNSSGIDLSNEHRLASLAGALLASAERDWRASPMLDGEVAREAREASGEWAPVLNPADHRDIVGHVQVASHADIDRACDRAVRAAPIWQVTPPAERSGLLERAADLMERGMPGLAGLLVREAAKTLANAIAEVREAVDFLRYYAAQVRREFSNATHRPLGPVVCISPWNFPLAIFTGQVGAALAAGNTVLAKPAEQTPLVAAEAVRILRDAGIPAGVIQLLPGPGETVGARLSADLRVRGILFTGSLEVARLLQRSIAGRLDAEGRGVPLIAETGGLNAMIVDSSALAEQVVEDVMASAFDSAGQRCSALRVLCLQDDIAERILAMLRGAMAEYRMGNPEHLAVDIGPVIDAQARDRIERHIQMLRDGGHTITRLARVEGSECDHGTFVLPALIELDQFGELTQEVFGPVLHVVRYRRRELGALLDQIHAAGYGLTLGLQTRIDEVIARVVEQARVGNLYVNRNMVGATVGVQPFGGEGRSGTGPKAGGPLYLYRLLSMRPVDALHHSLSRHLELHRAQRQDAMLKPLSVLQKWARRQGLAELAATCERFDAQSMSGTTCLLDGPTGERNSYSLVGRNRVLCLAESDSDLLIQLAAVLAVGSSVCWMVGEMAAGLRARLPKDIQTHITLIEAIDAEEALFDAALHHGDPDQLRNIRQQLAQRPGAIVTVHGWPHGDTSIPLDCLLVERVLSINTAASGGNASLMNVG